jgi:hypothetical protein
MPAPVMHFYSGSPMHFLSGVDSGSVDEIESGQVSHFQDGQALLRFLNARLVARNGIALPRGPAGGESQ